jgi:hypothetical protein
VPPDESCRADADVVATSSPESSSDAAETTTAVKVADTSGEVIEDVDVGQVLDLDPLHRHFLTSGSGVHQ